MAKMHWCLGVIFWRIKTLFRFINSGIKVYFETEDYFLNNIIFFNSVAKRKIHWIHWMVKYSSEYHGKHKMLFLILFLDEIKSILL